MKNLILLLLTAFILSHGINALGFQSKGNTDPAEKKAVMKQVHEMSISYNETLDVHRKKVANLLDKTYLSTEEFYQKCSKDKRLACRGDRYFKAHSVVDKRMFRQGMIDGDLLIDAKNCLALPEIEEINYIIGKKTSDFAVYLTDTYAARDYKHGVEYSMHCRDKDFPWKDV